MHAAVLHALGKPPRFEEFPDPTPGEGEVLINVSAAALKPVDKQMAAGTHYQPARISCRLRDGWRGAARRRHASGLRRTAAALRRDGRAHCASPSSMFFDP